LRQRLAPATYPNCGKRPTPLPLNCPGPTFTRPLPKRRSRPKAVARAVPRLRALLPLYRVRRRCGDGSSRRTAVLADWSLRAFSDFVIPGLYVGVPDVAGEIREAVEKRELAVAEHPEAPDRAAADACGQPPPQRRCRVSRPCAARSSGAARSHPRRAAPRPGVVPEA
jgi:hypothetical protein